MYFKHDPLSNIGWMKNKWKVEKKPKQKDKYLIKLLEG